MMTSVMASTIGLNAAPMITATASSRALPCAMNSLNPLIMAILSSGAGRRLPGVRHRGLELRASYHSRKTSQRHYGLSAMPSVLFVAAPTTRIALLAGIASVISVTFLFPVHCPPSPTC